MPKKRSKYIKENDEEKKVDTLSWKPVDVQLEEPSNEDHQDNHYNEATEADAKSAERDLEAQPGEGVAMFFGLEVLDGSQYTVERNSNGVSHFKILVPDASPEEASSLLTKKRERQLQVQETHQPKQLSSHDNETSKSERKKRKKKTKRTATSKNETTTAAPNERGIDKRNTEIDKDSQQLQSLQSSWCAATGGCVLHNSLVRSLLRQEFWHPTPIQAASLAPSILGRRNIVGAAPTGSGKTLAFLLPIFQHLLNEDDDWNVSGSSPPPLQALVLTPTRELALQITAEAGKLVPPNEKPKNWVGCVVGGLAHAKQVRVIDQDRPPVIVGTVGRLWELLSSGNHPHLTELSRLQFLVIDEADRMVQQGSFPQLSRILGAVDRANPTEDSDDENDGDEPESLHDSMYDSNRLLSLPGVPGEAKVQMLTDDVMNLISRQREDETGEAKEIEESEFVEQNEKELPSFDDDELSLPMLPPVHRQTFIFSATLTLPSSQTPGHQKKRKRSDVDGAIGEILSVAKVSGRNKVIDLSFASDNTKGTQSKPKKKMQKDDASKTFRLPPGLRLQQIKCTQMHKDSHLYGYLMTTRDGGSGPCLVFCNSIAGVKRVGATLQTLGLQVRMLHANMQQRARLKVVESLRTAKQRIIVVSTDVAARGLDFPSVAVVVNYDVARNVDTFVHRSGRTARGVGNKAVGCSLSLIAPAEDKAHTAILTKLAVPFEKVFLDGRLLNGAQERTNLASKIVSVDKIQSQVQRDSAWFRNQALEAGLDLDDNINASLESLADGDHRDRDRLRQAEHAKKELRFLLSQPLQTQRYGKFLSTNSAARMPSR